jgi:hypothetical protein
MKVAKADSEMIARPPANDGGDGEEEEEEVAEE